MRHTIWSGAACGLLAIMLASVARAQVAGEYVPGESTADFSENTLVRSGLFARDRDVSVLQRPHAELQPLGMTLGGFVLNAAVRSGLSYDSDILARPGSPSDEVWLIEPSAQIQSNWSRHVVTVFARAAENLYVERSDQSTLSYTVGTNDRIDLGGDAAVSVGGSFGRQTDPLTDLGTPNNAAKAVRFDSAKAYVGAVKQFNRLRLVASANVRDDAYSNVQSETGGVIYQRDRDTTTTTLSARAEYAVNAGLSVYVNAAGNQRLYRNELPGEPNRNSHGYDVAVGANFDLTHLLRGEVEAGYLDQTFKAAIFPTVSGFSVRGQLQYFLSPLTTISLTSGQTVGDSAIVGAAGFLQTTEQIAIDHEVLRSLVLSAHLANENDRIRGIDRNDERISAGASAKFLVTRSLGVIGGYNFFRDSSTGTARGPSYNINVVFVSFVYQL